MAGRPNPQASHALSGAYRAVWRWHFYAGVFVMPVLMLLALTGGLYPVSYTHLTLPTILLV